MDRRKEKETWIDSIKLIACILVAVGHFFQSMVSSQIIPSSALYQWFITGIYYFHVPLFFICSGYLYQKTTCIKSAAQWGKTIVKKLIVLGIPYFTFSLMTWVLKYVFSSQVNLQNDGLLKSLFVHPISPYWYLYILFLLFLFVPVGKNRRMINAMFGAALVLKIAACIWMLPNYILDTFMSNAIWFVAGMAMYEYNVASYGEKTCALYVSAVVGGIFLALSFVQTNTRIFAFAMGILGCGAVVLLMMYLFCRIKKATAKFASYTMPVFLMHTIFAAGVRAVLFKLGVVSPVLHIAAGLLASFVGPIVAIEIMQRVKLDVLVYPQKYLKI